MTGKTKSFSACVALLAFGSVTLLCGCGRTVIMTNNPQARIYVDGQLKGNGVAKITKRGFPRTAHVVIKSNGETVRRSIEREFTGMTFLLGMISYATGFLWAWEYPESVIIQLPMDHPRKSKRSGWDKAPAGSNWESAPVGWE